MKRRHPGLSDVLHAVHRASADMENQRHRQPLGEFDVQIAQEARVVLAADQVPGGVVEVSRLAPALMVKWFFRATETHDRKTIAKRVAHVMKHPDQLAWMHKLIAYVFPLSLRRVGLDNDLAQFAAIEDYPLAGITAPTLVVHGRHDGNVPYEHAEFVTDGVGGADALTVECGHLIWMSEHAEMFRTAILEFLGRHADRTDDY